MCKGDNTNRWEYEDRKKCCKIKTRTTDRTIENSSTRKRAYTKFQKTEKRNFSAVNLESKIKNISRFSASWLPFP